jgi:peptidoglycan/xylan/chitin deacetylase (PgdA/CDA1 family)
MTRNELLAPGAIALAIAAALLFGPYAVSVDGYPQWITRGTTVGDLVTQHRVRAFPGDLRDVRGGLLMPRAGGAPLVAVNGSIASSTAVLPFGAVVGSDRGPDSVEPTVALTVETTPPLEFRGHGPVESVEESGSPGTAQVVRGAVSGIVLQQIEITRGLPVTVRREPAWPGRKRVALTFDDGPWPRQTERVLAQLKDAGARATFFMVGYLATRHPVIARDVAAAGMEIGAHSQSHKLLRRASDALVRSEISKGIASVKRVTGKRPVFYRPAGGSVNAFVYLEAKREKVRIVLWTVDPRDWSRPGTRTIARRVLDNIRPGSVVLMHDGGGDRSQTLAALKLVLHGLKARGYEMVTLSQLYAKP